MPMLVSWTFRPRTVSSALADGGEGGLDLGDVDLCLALADEASASRRASRTAACSVAGSGSAGSMTA